MTSGIFHLNIACYVVVVDLLLVGFSHCGIL